MNEPEPTAEVVFTTTKGKLRIEVWAREMPRAARNFLEQCRAGYYNGITVDRVTALFAQLGPDSDQTIYAKTIELETNGRLRFSRRGIIGCKNSQLVLTLGPASDLSSQCTVLARLSKDSIYVLADIASAERDGERPPFPARIDKTEIVKGFFGIPTGVILKPDPAVNPADPGTKNADASKPRKRQIQLYDEEEPAITIKRKARVDPLLEKLQAFEKRLPEFVRALRDT